MRPAFVLLLFLLALPVSAQQAEVVNVRAWAPSEMVKPIWIEVTVCNRGDKPASNGIAQLVLIPQFRSYKNQSPGMMDPRTMETSVSTIGSGQTKTFRFQTPYFSRTAFSSSNGVFRVENLIPGICRSTTVQYQVFLQGPPGEFFPPSAKKSNSR